MEGSVRFDFGNGRVVLCSDIPSLLAHTRNSDMEVLHEICVEKRPVVARSADQLLRFIKAVPWRDFEDKRLWNVVFCEYPTLFQLNMERVAFMYSPCLEDCALLGEIHAWRSNIDAISDTLAMLNTLVYLIRKRPPQIPTFLHHLIYHQLITVCPSDWQDSFHVYATCYAARYKDKSRKKTHQITDIVSVVPPSKPYRLQPVLELLQIATRSFIDELSCQYQPTGAGSHLKRSRARLPENRVFVSRQDLRKEFAEFCSNMNIEVGRREFSFAMSIIWHVTGAEPQSKKTKMKKMT